MVQVIYVPQLKFLDPNLESFIVNSNIQDLKKQYKTFKEVPITNALNFNCHISWDRSRVITKTKKKWNLDLGWTLEVTGRMLSTVINKNLKGNGENDVYV